MWCTLLSVLSLSNGVARADSSAPWRLVAVYDLAGAAAVGREGKADPSTSCGPAKAPDGLGVFEAEAMASGLSPTLAILLRREPDAPPRPPHADELRVSLQDHGQRVTLQPATLPRALRVEITGGAEARYKQLTRTMIEKELCLEHKVGRAWIGALNTQGALREAYLLDPPANSHVDRRFFGGQRDPVPALLPGVERGAGHGLG